MVLMYSPVKKPRITDLSVIQYHSNGYYKLKENLTIENRKTIEQKIMKPKVQC